MTTTTTISPSPMVDVGQGQPPQDQESRDSGCSRQIDGRDGNDTVTPGNRGTATYRRVPGESLRPTDVHPQPARPRRGELHGADDPWGWADSMRRRRAARGGAP